MRVNCSICLSLIVVVSYVVLIILISVSIVFPIAYPGSKDQKLFDSYMVLAELGERRVGSILGYRSSSLKEF
jgi:hypothetical protein